MKRTGYGLVVSGLVAAFALGGTSVAAGGEVPADDKGVRTAQAADSASVAAPVAARFIAQSPQRVLDTRESGGPVGPSGVRTIDLSALVPVSATAVVLNVTGTGPTASTFVTVYPGGGPRPDASNLNLLPGQTRPNAVTVALGVNRTVSLYNFNGSVHLIADLAGYYSTTEGLGFAPQSPERVLDTRGNPAPIGPGGVVSINLNGLPSTASAITFNLTGVGATAGTFITAWPSDEPRPTTSSLNLAPGEITPNQVTVRIGSSRTVNLYNFSGEVDLIADLAGYYSSGGLEFYQLDPERVYDSREDIGWFAGEVYTMDLSPVVPANTAAVVFNLTGTNTTESTFVTAWPSDFAPPNASNLNLAPGQTAPNLVTVAVGPNDFTPIGIDVYNHAGYVDLIFDLAGYFAPA